MNDQKSRNAFEKARQLIPGGVNSPVRAFGGVERTPLFIEKAAGSHIWDIDGNEYIDYVGSWGPMILGHAHPEIVHAVCRAAEKGTSFGAATETETELARRITSACPAIEKLRLVSSGTEAVMTALRLARAFTNRRFIVKMIGCYHGHSDAMLVRAGSGAAESSVPSSAGVPAAFAGLTLTVPYNDLDALAGLFRKHRDQIAAVIVEPVAANMGVVLPVDGYLEGIRELCDTHRSLLIADEVITGFRLRYGTAMEGFGIKADLTCLGKIVGGGLPAAAIGGRADIMDLLAPLGPVYQAGTLSGNPLAVAAANATLDLLSKPGLYPTLEQKTARLEDGFREAAKAANVPVAICRIGSLMSCFFSAGPVRNFDEVCASDIPRFKRFFCRMLDEGIYLAPSAYEAMFVSLAHTDSDLDKTIRAAYNAFAYSKAM